MRKAYDLQYDLWKDPDCWYQVQSQGSRRYTCGADRAAGVPRQRKSPDKIL